MTKCLLHYPECWCVLWWTLFVFGTVNHFILLIEKNCKKKTKRRNKGQHFQDSVSSLQILIIWYFCLRKVLAGKLKIIIICTKAAYLTIWLFFHPEIQNSKCNMFWPYKQFGTRMKFLRSLVFGLLDIGFQTHRKKKTKFGNYFSLRFRQF